MGRFYLLGPGDMIYSVWEQEALYMTFAEKLAALRQKYGMTQEQVARAAGVTRQAVSRWERGTSLPDSVALLRLAEEFNVEPDWLMDEGEAGEPEPRRVKRGRFTMADRVWLVILAALLVFTAVYSAVFWANRDRIAALLMAQQDVYRLYQVFLYVQFVFLAPWMRFALGWTAGALFCRFALTPERRVQKWLRTAAWISMAVYALMFALSVLLRLVEVDFNSPLRLFYSFLANNPSYMMLPGALFALSRERPRLS